MTTVLLKRTDASVYILHTGHDWEQTAARLGSLQAFTVELVLLTPHIVTDTLIIEEPCKLLNNGWFFAPSDVQAAIVMLRNRSGSALDAQAEPDITNGECQSLAGDDISVNPDAEEDAMMWDYLEPCTGQEATKAVDLRAALTDKLGKAEATYILAQCSATVAKSAAGQKTECLKLEQANC